MKNPKNENGEIEEMKQSVINLRKQISEMNGNDESSSDAYFPMFNNRTVYVNDNPAFPDDSLTKNEYIKNRYNYV